jgi:hypothetical protein
MFRLGELQKHWGRESLANALGASSETILNFGFRWSGIKEREIDLRTHQGAEFMSARASRQDALQCDVTIAAAGKVSKQLGKRRQRPGVVSVPVLNPARKTASL